LVSTLSKKSNGDKIDKDAEYFVLRLNGDGDPIHIKACRDAVLCYARGIKDHLPLLYKDLIEKYGYFKVISIDKKLWYGTFKTEKEAITKMNELKEIEEGSKIIRE
jgi:hypothetical protein